MNASRICVNERRLWSALPPIQRRQLLAMLGKWALRRWKAQELKDLTPANGKEDRREQKDPT
jgi:hypothetical protein